MRRSTNVTFLLMGLWVLLSWRGGLHAWQSVAAALLCLALFLAAPAPRLGRGEKLAWVALGLGATLGLTWAWVPQAHLNASLALALALGVFFVARRCSAWSPARVALGLLILGSVYSAVFLAWGYAGAASRSAQELSGPMLLPHLAVRGFMPNQNLLAGGLAVPAILLCLHLAAQGRLWAVLLALLPISALVYAGSRGAYLALGAGMLWLFLRSGQRRRAAAAALCALVVLGGLAWKAPFSRLAQRVAEQAIPQEADQNYFRRAEFWKGALRLSLQAPFGGHGLGSFEEAARRLDLPVSLTSRLPITRYRLHLEHAHNDWLELAVEAGWLVCLGLLASLAWIAWRRLRLGRGSGFEAPLEAALAAALAQSLFDMNLRTPGLVMGLVLIMASLSPRRDASGRPSWALPALAGLCLLAGLGFWALRLERLSPPAAAPKWLSLSARVLQPLDGRADARRPFAEQWAWSAWTGRHQAEWHWAQAGRLAGEGDTASAVASGLRAVACRPYWAPIHFQLAMLQGARGEAVLAQASVDEALRLEPNFARAWAWKVDQAMQKGDRSEARKLVQKIQAIQTLKIQSEAMDDYSAYIQAVDPVWLADRNKKLGLSTVFGQKS